MFSAMAAIPCREFRVDCCNKCWMFEVITLASGSEGNATLVRNETATFLIDAGLSARQLTARLLADGHLS